MDEIEARLLIIDGLNLVRRIYEARRDEQDLTRRITGALTAAMGSLKRALRDHGPTHAVIVMDSAGKNWRHDLFSEYKANRTPLEPMLRTAIENWLADEVLNTLGVVTVQLSGYEADDLIARIHGDWRILVGEGEAYPCVILTTDKDMLSLVEPGTVTHHHFDNVQRGEAWVRENFGIAPHQVQDYLALMGDSGDGVPGVTKIGPKTAADLLNKYGDLDGVLEAAPSMKGATGKRLVEEAHWARLSRELVRFQCRQPLPYTFDMLKLKA